MTRQKKTDEKPPQFWAESGTDNEGFSYGPFASIQEAVREMTSLGVPGEVFEVGRLVLFAPRIDVDAMFDRMTQSDDYHGPDDWPYHVAPEDMAHLEARLEIVLMQWLTEHGLVPTFGEIVDIQTFELFDDETATAGEVQP